MAAASGYRSWDALSHDILKQALDHLDTGMDLLSLMLVNQHWRAAAVQHQLWDKQPVMLLPSPALPRYTKNVNLTFGAVPTFEQILTRWNETCTDPFPVHSVNLMGESWRPYSSNPVKHGSLTYTPGPTTSTAHLLNILHTLPCLKHLDLSVVSQTHEVGNAAMVPPSTNYWLQPSQLQQLSSLHSLESLNLSGQCYFDAHELRHLTGLTRLRYLNISRCTCATYAALLHIAALPGLRELVMADNYNAGIYQLDDASMLTQLHLLHMNVSVALDDSNIRYLASLTNLTDLTLRSWIGDPSIQDTALSQLSSLTNLTSLCLHLNMLTVSSAILISLVKLKVLQLHCCHSRTLDLPSLGSLTNLEMLLLTNMPPGGLRSSLTELYTLTSLKITRGTWNDDDLAHLQQLSTLKMLDVQDVVHQEQEGHRFQTDVGQICRLPCVPYLEHLILKSKFLGAIEADRLSQLTSLTCLDLSHLYPGPRYSARNRATPWWPNLDEFKIALAAVAHLCTLVSLQRLDLSGCHIGANSQLVNNPPGSSGIAGGTLATDMSCLSKLSRLSNLTWLNLTCNDLGPAALPYLAQLPAIRTLLMGYNEVGAHRNTLTELSSLTRLVEADLQMNNLSHVAAVGLVSLTSLERLKVTGDELGAGGVLQLKQLPRLRALRVHFTHEVREREVDALVVNWRPQYKLTDCKGRCGEDHYCLWCDESYDKQSSQHTYDRVLYYCPGGQDVVRATSRERDAKLSTSHSVESSTAEPPSMRCVPCRQM